MTVADIAEVCVMAINRVVNRSRGCCIKQIKLFREDIAVRFFIISDLHLGEETDMQQLYTRTRTLCRKIRESTTPGEQIPIILLGDIVDGGNPDAFCAAKKLLTKIEQELKDYSTTFDFVPGNHDLHGTDLAAFDKFISKYGVPKFSENRAYNRQYGGVNFIFADSNLSRDHRACGEIDVAAIIELVKGGMTNVLLCHHSFTQEYGDTHDVINGGERFLEILAGHEIKFLIHGHTHRAAIDVHPYTVKEIGCGSFSKDSKKMGNIYKQFTVGCIREGTIVSIERWIDTDDGGEPFAYTQLFPKERQFKDPDSVGKQIYDDVPDYISRRVVVHNAEAVDLNSLTAIADVVKKRGSNVLVMGDAGHGKSVEMQHLAAELGRTAKFPFLYSLKQYCGQAIEDLCPEEYRDLLPSRQVLIFDGYDELGTYIDVFDRNLRAFCKDFPSVCIVISARGNFCQHKISQENVFANFTVCSLEELNERDIVQYISAHRIDSQALVVEAKEKGLADLLRNPFYLTRVVNLYLKYKQLPPRTELMDSLIEECMERDEGKFSEDLEENRKNSLQLLGKAATAMLLLQKQKLENTKEYQELFQLEERNLMNFSGLFRRENNSWSFTHNNFKEYLAARYISQLSKEDALALISDGYGIMPTWLNAVGFLLGMNTGEKRKCYLLDTLFDDPATLEKVRIAYEDGRLLSDIVLYDIACRYGSDAQYIACSKSVYSKGKKSFPPREPRVNYEELRAASDASYFAMLFDKKAAKQMLEDLTRYAGNPNVTVEELWENKISAEIHWSSPLMYLQYSIYNYVENKNSLVINFLQCVQWESFVLQEAQHMLSNTKNLKVFAWQRDTLIDIAQKTVEGSDILDAVKYDNDSVEVCPDVAAAIYLISYFEYPINIDSMKELVSFPEYVFCGENNGEKYEYLSKYVPVGDILAKIEMDLKSGTVCRSTVRDHIEYCEKKKYRGIKDIAVMLCTDESQDELLQNYALRYLYEVFGSDCVRNEVVPFASEQLLLQIYHVCRDVPKEPLCKVMQDKFAESKSFELMAPLIILGSELALKEYLLYAKENHRIPERVDSFDGPTEAISKISDPQKIGILAELLQIAMEPSFRDGDFFTLRSGVANALVNCGKEKPEAVIAVFERQIALEKQEINIRCCNDAIERIGQLTRGKFRQPMSLRDVKTVLQRMIS